MSQFKIWRTLIVAVMLIPALLSCGNDDEESATGDDLFNHVIGTWMCKESMDIKNGQSQNGLMVGKEITLYSNNTYKSTSSTLGYSGSYSISENIITAKSSSVTFVITARIKGDKMTWEGTASTGATFKYVFLKENDDVGIDTSPSSKYDPETSTYGPLTLTPSGTINIGDDEGTLTVKVSTNQNAPWSVGLNSYNSINCTVSPTSGRGDGIVYIKYPARKSMDSESAVIIFYYHTYGNYSATETVDLLRKVKKYW